MNVLPLSEVRARFSELINSAVHTHERIVITRNGRPVAALISIEDLESLEETLDVISHPELGAAIREGGAELARGKFATEAETLGDLAQHRTELMAKSRSQVLSDWAETIEALRKT